LQPFILKKIKKKKKYSLIFVKYFLANDFSEYVNDSMSGRKQTFFIFFLFLFGFRLNFVDTAADLTQ